MKSLLTVAELEERFPSGALPLSQNGETLDVARIEIAISDATGMIVAQLPWLLDEESGDIRDDIPPQFDSAIRSFCADITRHKLTDTVTSSEDEREWFKTTMTLIEKIDREYKGGLSGPGLQESFVVEADEENGIPETRFFKKGRIF